MFVPSTNTEPTSLNPQQTHIILQTQHSTTNYIPGNRSSWSSSNIISCLGPLVFMLMSSVGKLAGSGDVGLD